MAEACPGCTKSSLEDIQAWYIRDETYSAALAELVNAQGKRPLAVFWGDGTTSSSDGQNFRTGNSGRYAGQINPKYGQEPGCQFYTHISDQYSPFYTCIISRVRDSWETPFSRRTPYRGLRAPLPFTLDYVNDNHYR